MRLERMLSLLQRFPQGSYVAMHGDSGLSDLRVEVDERYWKGLIPEDGPYYPGYFSVDTPDAGLPWLPPSPLEVT
jgi:hypothetical protein